jgi:biopolymer transport protein ExbB/TolQ
MTSEELQNLQNAIQQGNWIQIVVCGIIVLLSLLTTIYTIVSKVALIKAKAENQKLAELQQQQDAEYKRRELENQAKYNADMAELKKMVLNRVDENEQKAKEETEAKAVKIG